MLPEACNRWQRVVLCMNLQEVWSYSALLALHCWYRFIICLCFISPFDMVITCSAILGYNIVWPVLSGIRIFSYYMEKWSVVRIYGVFQGEWNALCLYRILLYEHGNIASGIISSSFGDSSYRLCTVLVCLVTDDEFGNENVAKVRV